MAPCCLGNHGIGGRSRPDEAESGLGFRRFLWCFKTEPEELSRSDRPTPATINFEPSDARMGPRILGCRI